MREFFCGVKDFINHVRRFDFSDFLSCGITSAEYALMDLISDKMKLNKRESVWVSEITEEVPVTAQAVSKGLRALEAKGCIERFVNEKDRRMTGVRFLDNGKRVYAEAQREITDFVDRLELEFDEDERMEFMRLTAKFERVFMESIELKVKQKQKNGGQ